MIRKFKIKFFLLLMGLLANIHANNFLWVQDGIGTSFSSNNSVFIVMANDDNIGGLQFTLNYDATSPIYLEQVILTEHTEHLDIYTSTTEPGTLNVIVLGLEGELLLPGVHSVVELQFGVLDYIPPSVVPLNLSDVSVSDVGGLSIPASWANGYFFVETPNALRIENGMDTVSINLYNQFTAGGVQFTLEFNSEFVTLDTINATLRSEDMELSYNVIAPGQVTVLLYSFEQGTIFPGSGSIVQTTFTQLTDISTMIPLTLSNVAVSDAEGVTVEVELYDGVYSLPGETLSNSYESSINKLPNIFTLNPAFPNPFNPETVISYQLSVNSTVIMHIYDISGRLVETLVDGITEPGTHTVKWNASDFSSGVYFVQLVTGEFSKTQKVLLLK
ncbi:MAG: T9SS type A sorting domain-containing protein [Candidatus Marinimicrobia bacterium]|nr:T9SS type A sorting domain-containing protein [Candidatus Neomarinimicrobiota bacterium]MBL7060144.1 T9SS type A sorting domain-containing protein [Candidatus Neomarinimicrobiota bacterium]